MASVSLWFSSTITITLCPADDGALLLLVVVLGAGDCEADVDGAEVEEADELVGAAGLDDAADGVVDVGVGTVLVDDDDDDVAEIGAVVMTSRGG